MTTIFEENSPTREIGDGEHLKKMFSLADERPLSDDGSLVRGCVEELVAKVARHPALGVVGRVPPHLEERRSLGDVPSSIHLAVVSWGEEEGLCVWRSRHLLLWQ